MTQERSFTMNIKNQIIQAPPISALNNHAMFLGVLFLNPTYERHFFSHYVNLQYDPESIWKIVNFIIPRFYTEEDFLVVTEMAYDRFDMFSDEEFLKLIYKMMNQGYYLYGHVNEKYIPDRPAYQQVDFMHDILLYGANVSEEKLDCISYVMGDDMISVHYKPGELNYNNFIKAIKEISNRNHFHFFKAKENYEFKFDADLLKAQLHDYLNARNETFDMQYSSSCVFGIAVYDPIIKEIESNEDFEYFDHRITKILLEHKQCMLQRIEYLISHHIISSENDLLDYKNVVTEFEQIHSLAIKYSVTGSMRIKAQICEKITSAIELEKTILLNLINVLETITD